MRGFHEVCIELVGVVAGVHVCRYLVYVFSLAFC